MKIKEYTNSKYISELFKRMIIDVSIYQYLSIEYSGTVKNRILVYILAFSTAITISASLIFFLYIPLHATHSIVFIFLIILQILSAVFFLVKIYRKKLSEDLFIISELILITTVSFNHHPQSVEIYKTAMLIIPTIMLGSALFSERNSFISHSLILIFFSLITYFVRKDEFLSLNLNISGEIYSYSLVMIIYAFIMLIILRLLFGEMLKNYKFISNVESELSEISILASAPRVADAMNKHQLNTRIN